MKQTSLQNTFFLITLGMCSSSVIMPFEEPRQHVGTLLRQAILLLEKPNRQVLAIEEKIYEQQALATWQTLPTLRLLVDINNRRNFQKTLLACLSLQEEIDRINSRLSVPVTKQQKKRDIRPLG